MAFKKDFQHKGVNLTVHKIIKFTMFDFIVGRIQVEVAKYFNEIEKDRNANNYITKQYFTIPMDKIDVNKNIRKEVYKWIKNNSALYTDATEV